MDHASAMSARKTAITSRQLSRRVAVSAAPAEWSTAKAAARPAARREGRGEADREAAEGEGGEGRGREVPGAERRVGVRIFEGDEVEDRNVTGPGKRAVAKREVERGEAPSPA